MLRLTLLCHGATAATRRAAFPADEPLETESLERLAPLAGRLRRADSVVTSPALRTRQTAEALGFAAREEPALRDLDHGRWAGRAIADIAASEPAALEAMMRADDAPHGGETRAALTGRVSAWMEQRQGERGHFLAVTHAAVIRAAALRVLDAPAGAFWRIDVEPLSLTELRFDGHRWALRSLNRTLDVT